MDCPVCGARTIVQTCRRDCEGVYRVRVCVDPTCKHRFFTSEYESDAEAFHQVDIERKRAEHNKKHNKNYNKNG